jgi:ABC-type thiamine transport system ATPase subunit
MTTTDQKPLSKRALKAIEQEENIEYLRNLIAGDEKPVIYTILRHVSSSGMSRDISLIYIKNNSIYHLNYSAAMALGDRLVSRNSSDAIRVNGCGMDMGFHLVYNLSSVLFAGQERAGYVLSHRWM